MEGKGVEAEGQDRASVKTRKSIVREKNDDAENDVPDGRTSQYHIFENTRHMPPHLRSLLFLPDCVVCSFAIYPPFANCTLLSVSCGEHTSIDIASISTAKTSTKDQRLVRSRLYRSKCSLLRPPSLDYPSSDLGFLRPHSFLNASIKMT